jgi:hypothetical protein
MTLYRIRWIEWQSAAIFVAIGLALALPGQTMSQPLFGAFLLLMPEQMWSATLIIAGCIRAGALIINGRSPRGSPVVRAASAMFSAAIFAGLAAGFAQNAPTGLWAASVYLTLTAFELATVYRAVRELHGALFANHPA